MSLNEFNIFIDKLRRVCDLRDELFNIDLNNIEIEEHCFILDLINSGDSDNLLMAEVLINNINGRIKESI